MEHELRYWQSVMGLWRLATRVSEWNERVFLGRGSDDDEKRRGGSERGERGSRLHLCRVLAHAAQRPVCANTHVVVGGTDRNRKEGRNQRSKRSFPPSSLLDKVLSRQMSQPLHIGFVFNRETRDKLRAAT